MKQNKDKLIGWFNELGGARGLPYEITKVFSEDEEGELIKSVYVSFEHVERVLEFGNLLDIKFEVDEDEEDLWVDIVTRLEIYSYYACLAMPLVRQLLETNKGLFVYTCIESENIINWTDLPHFKKPKEFLSLPGERLDIADDAWNLSCKMAKLGRRYSLLASSQELYDWTKYFLEYSARLISLVARLSRL
jgi:hypothetical protein